MPLDKQVCSLDLAKRLKELGVKQKSHFFWCRLGSGDRITDNTNLSATTHYKHWHSAFTVAELGEMFGEQGLALLHRWPMDDRRLLRPT